MNIKSLFKKYPELLFAIKFLLLFTILYYFNKAWIGLSTPDNLYIPFIEKYLDYISWLRHSILFTSKYFTAALGYNTTLIGKYKIAFVGGNSITMVYSCIGYGIMSFWAAFIITWDNPVKRKIIWLITGLISIWIINVLRISFLLIYINSHKSRSLFESHHTVYNIVAYALIITLAYFYTKENKVKK